MFGMSRSSFFVAKLGSLNLKSIGTLNKTGCFIGASKGAEIQAAKLTLLKRFNQIFISFGQEGLLFGWDLLGLALCGVASVFKGNMRGGIAQAVYLLS